jgi:transposase-like protein
MPNTPDPEVPEQAKRRRFTAAYKARILAAADACSEPGQIGALLRREGLYSSHLSTWAASAPGRHAGGAGAKTAGPPGSAAPRAGGAAAQAGERAPGTAAGQAEVVIEVQKKLSALLEIPLPADERDASS